MTYEELHNQLKTVLPPPLADALMHIITNDTQSWLEWHLEYTHHKIQNVGDILLNAKHEQATSIIADYQKRFKE